MRKQNNTYSSKRFLKAKWKMLSIIVGLVFISTIIVASSIVTVNAGEKSQFGLSDTYRKSTRLYGVGTGHWMGDINGDGRADYVYNRTGTKEYRVMLADEKGPQTPNGLQEDKLAGNRNSNNNVGYDNDAQWMADVNGDGRADIVYNRHKTDEYWVMLGKSDGTFEKDKKAGNRNNNNDVGYDGKSQWMADINGDGRADYVYYRNKTDEYWVMLANADGTFQEDRLAGTRKSGNDVAFYGLEFAGEWMADVNGDGCADFLYHRNKTNEYWVMLGTGDGKFKPDKKAGTRNGKNDAAFDYKAQWLADVNGDGAADFVYNRNKTKEYWVMIANDDGTFREDKKWGSRNDNNDIEYDIYGQSMVDMNSDGCMDFVYCRRKTNEYWVMLSQKNSFKTDQLWGTKESGKKIGWDGRGQFFADVSGDGFPDLIYNDDSTRDEWVVISNPVTDENNNLSDVRFLDIWGEGYIIESDMNMITGFQNSFNLNKFTQLVSNGPNTGKAIPKFISVAEYNNPSFPIRNDSVEIMTLMGAPITKGVAEEMYRTINKESGNIVLYEPDKGSLQNFEKVFLEGHNWFDVSAKTELKYPFNKITIKPYHVYRHEPSYQVLKQGKGANVRGAALTSGNFLGKTKRIHDEF